MPDGGSVVGHPYIVTLLDRCGAVEYLGETSGLSAPNDMVDMAFQATALAEGVIDASLCGLDAVAQELIEAEHRSAAMLAGAVFELYELHAEQDFERIADASKEVRRLTKLNNSLASIIS